MTKTQLYLTIFVAIATILKIIIDIAYHKKLWKDFSRLSKAIQKSIRPSLCNLKREPYKPAFRLLYIIFGDLSQLAFVALGVLECIQMMLLDVPSFLCLLVFVLHIALGTYFKFVFKKISLGFK